MSELIQTFPYRPLEVASAMRNVDLGHGRSDTP